MGDSNNTTIEQEVQNQLQSSINTEEPYIGQEFNTLDDIYAFYNCFARNSGFGIRKSSSSKSHASKKLIWKRYECDKAGMKNVSFGSNPIVKRHRETRSGCEAKVDVRRNKQNKWVITSIIKEHNHVLDTPRRTKKHRSHQTSHKTLVAKNLMEQLHGVGIGPSRIAKALNATGTNCIISTQNVIDHLRVNRLNNVGREGVIVAQYLQAQIVKDSNFYFALELDTDGMLRSMFWADSRARDDYFMFGDVIVFDVTYRTNNLMMSFAPFTGVNHHRQSILLGCALLADETEETFIWLFKQWLKCMFVKQPTVIITDMDGAMFNAIKIVFPQARHRFCSWHISKHVVEHVHAMRDAESDFSKDYRKWYYSKSIASSEITWSQLISKHQLESNTWLMKMWKNRYYWVPAFLTDVFTAGMTSTGRSESINAFFDGFVNSNTHLLEFVKQYEKAMISRRQAEEDEDFKTLNSTASLISNTGIEAHAGQCYTRSMFLMFQCEFKASLECWHEKISKVVTTTTYSVGLCYEERSNWSTVIFEEDGNISCDCRKFQTAGYVCKHMLHIMNKKHLTSLPDKFILKRWTIDARHISLCRETTTDDYVTPFMKWSLTSLCNKLVEKASSSISTYKDIYSLINDKVVEFSLQELVDEPSNCASQVGSTMFSCDIAEISIKDPQIVKTKGRPKIASRIASGLEISQKFIKKRTCGYCGCKGHYTTTCPNKTKDKQQE